MRKIFILLLFLPYLLSAQEEYADPMVMNISEAMLRNIESIECTSTTHFQNDTKDSKENIVSLYFDKKGQYEIYKTANYFDQKLGDLETHTINYTFRNDSIVREDLEVVVQGAVTFKEFIYDGELLMETTEERLMRERPFKTVYQYLPNQKLDKKIYAVRGDPYIQYSYEGDFLIKEAFYPDEEDEPINTTTYRYSQKGSLVEKLKVSLENGDTIAWAKYNENGQPIRLQYFAKAYQNGYGTNEELEHWEFFDYDEKGLLKKKRFAVEMYHAPKEGEFFKEMFYHYEADRLVRIDSVNAVKHFTYNDKGLLVQVISQNKKANTDTIAIENFKYNENGLILEHSTLDYISREGSKWVYTYLGDKKTSQTFYTLSLEKKCSQTNTYDLKNKALIKEQFCSLNERNLPGDLPFDRREVYFDDKGRLLVSIGKYANHDGAVHISRKDSFVIEDNRIEKMIVHQFREGNKGRETIAYYNYNKENVLERIYSVVESDTIHYIDYKYVDGIEVLKTQYGYGHTWDGKPLGKQNQIEHNPKEKYTIKTLYKLNGDVAGSERWDYNEYKLPIKHIVIDRGTETRKIYKYTYYDK